MRLLAWNIRQGGGSRLAAIGEALARHDADILVLSEYHPGDSGQRLRTLLQTLGYPHASRIEPPPGRKGVLIAARTPLREIGPLTTDVAEPHRLINVAVGPLHLTGVYMPNLLAKTPYWEALLAILAPRLRRRAIAIGDFNTCRAHLDEAGATDRTGHYMDRIDTIGFHDLWRRRNPQRREYSWFSHRQNGFRIDHAFLSPPLARRAGPITYSHTEREAGLSDHSVLLVEI